MYTVKVMIYQTSTSSSSQHVYCQSYDLSDINHHPSSQHVYCQSYDLSDIIRHHHLVNMYTVKVMIYQTSSSSI